MLYLQSEDPSAMLFSAPQAFLNLRCEFLYSTRSWLCQNSEASTPPFCPDALRIVVLAIDGHRTLWEGTARLASS